MWIIFLWNVACWPQSHKLASNNFPLWWIIFLFHFNNFINHASSLISSLLFSSAREWDRILRLASQSILYKGSPHISITWNWLLFKIIPLVVSICCLYSDDWTYALFSMHTNDTNSSELCMHLNLRLLISHYQLLMVKIPGHLECDRIRTILRGLCSHVSQRNLALPHVVL